MIQYKRTKMECGRTRVRILCLCSTSGRPTEKRFGIRRRIAESMSFGRFVAPKTNILSVLDVRPSHKLDNRESTESTKRQIDGQTDRRTDI